MQMRHYLIQSDTNRQSAVKLMCLGNYLYTRLKGVKEEEMFLMKKICFCLECPYYRLPA